MSKQETTETAKNNNPPKVKKMSSLQRLMLSVSASLKQHTQDYCNIETTDGIFNLVMNDGTMVSLIRMNGILNTMNGDEFVNLITNMSEGLSAFLKKGSYKIGCYFRSDLDCDRIFDHIARTKKNTARNIQLDVDDLIDEDINNYRNTVYDEEVYFSVITSVGAMDTIELSVEADKRAEIKCPNSFSYAQNPFAVVEGLRAKHEAFVGRFLSTINSTSVHIDIERVNVLEALGTIAHYISPNARPRSWTPIGAFSLKNTKGDKWVNEKDRFFAKMPVVFDELNNGDLSYIMPPALPNQLMAFNVTELGGEQGLPKETLLIDGNLYTSCFMQSPPTRPVAFQELFTSLAQSSFTEANGKVRRMPYIVSFLISGDGMAGNTLKNVLKDFFRLVPPSSNAKIYDSYRTLKAYESAGGCVVGLQIGIMTWVKDTPAMREQLVSRRTRMKNALETWGSVLVTEYTADPMLSFTSNLPALTKNHQGTKAVANLPDVLSMLPLTRPASPYGNYNDNKGATIINQTQDGKLMLLEDFSSVQSSWITLYSGIQGSGKSVSMNNDLFETCLLAGMDNLPFITIIDKGFSSTVLISLLQDRLVEHKRHLVSTQKLQRVGVKNTINPFDVKVGLTYPLSHEKETMIQFLTRIFTPAEREKPYDGMAEFVLFLIDNLFNSFQEGEANVKEYRYGTFAELDEYLTTNKVIAFARSDLDINLEYSEDEKYTMDYHISYDDMGRLQAPMINLSQPKPIACFALVRKLHVIGENAPFGSEQQIRAFRARDLAHRMAMPTIGDLSVVLNNPTIVAQRTARIAEVGQTFIEYANQIVASTLSEFPTFCGVTRLEVDNTRIVSLDMQDVISEANQRQTSLFYQIAVMVALRRISLSEQDLESEIMPPLFLPYYQRMFDSIKKDRKVISIDEYHNTKGDANFTKQIEVISREGRKWGLKLVLGSQNLKDMENIISRATKVCLCSAPKGEDLALFQAHFDNNPDTVKLMGHIGLSQGLSYLAVTKAKNDIYVNLLNMKVGYKRIWALTTDSDDIVVRRYMNEITGNPTVSLDALAYYFGSGARKKIRDLRASAGLSFSDDQKQATDEVYNLIKNEVIKAFDKYDNEVLVKKRQKNLEKIT